MSLTADGESHSPSLGMRLTGFPGGLRVDLEAFRAFLDRRAPGRDAFSTPRREADEPVFLSGLADGVTDGSAIVAEIRNADTRSGDYEKTVPRPGHADYPNWVKTGRIPPGGGANSGRMTAIDCVAGGLCLQALAARGVSVCSEIVRVGDVAAAKAEGDSVGGIVRCTVTGLPVGLGDPLFGGFDTALAAAMFSIPGVRGFEIGNGFAAADLRGSENNDAFAVRDGRVVTVTNRHGGVLGGMTSGMPVAFAVALKPTPSISRPQRSVDLATMTETELRVRGRHDPCIVIRARPVVEALAAFVALDFLLSSESA